MKIGIRPVLAGIICIVVIVVTVVVIVVSESLHHRVAVNLAYEHADTMSKLATSAVDDRFRGMITSARRNQRAVSRTHMLHPSEYPVIPANSTSENSSSWHSTWFQFCERPFLSGSDSGIVHTLMLFADGSVMRCKDFDGILINYAYSPLRAASDRRVERHYYMTDVSAVPAAQQLPYAFPNDFNSSQFPIINYPQRVIGSNQPDAILFTELGIVAFPSQPVLPLITTLHDAHGTWLGNSVTATSSEQLDALLKAAFTRTHIAGAVNSRVYLVYDSQNAKFQGGVLLASSDDANATTRECFNYSHRAALLEKKGNNSLCAVSPITDIKQACMVCHVAVDAYAAFPPLKAAVSDHWHRNKTRGKYKYDGEEYLTVGTELDLGRSVGNVNFPYKMHHYVFFPISAVLRDVQDTRLASIGVAVLSAIVMSIVAMLLTTWTLAPLTAISAEMDRAANLQVSHPESADSIAKDSHLAEVYMLQCSLRLMQSKLADVRSFVPHALFDAPNVESEQFILPRVNPLQRDMMSDAQPAMEQMPVSSAAFSGVQNREFTNRVASAMSLHIYMPEKTSSKPYGNPALLQKIMQIFTGEVMSSLGIIDSLAFPNLVATFNGQQACFQPARRSVETAMRVADALREISTSPGGGQPDFHYSLIVDTSMCSIGTVGTKDHRAAIAIGDAMKHSTALHAAAACYYPMFPVLFTSRTRSEMFDFPCMPVDCLELTDSRGRPGPPITILAPTEGVILSKDTTFLEQYTAAFAILRSDISEAKQLLTEINRETSNDILHERCVTLCRNIEALQKCRRHTLVRGSRCPWESLGQQMPADVSLGSWSFFPHCLPQGNVSTTSRTSSQERQLLDEQVLRKSVGVEDETSLVPMIIIPDSEIDSSAPLASVAEAGDSNTAHPPTVFHDTEGREWRRGGDGIGKGTFGVVYRAMSKEGNIAVMKALPLSECSNVDELVEELEVSKTLLHQNIVCFFASAVLESHFVLLMEYVAGGTLASLLEVFAPLHLSACKRFTGEILAGLCYMHSRGITHVDVKPANVLLGHDQTCKLSDFGSALNRPRHCENFDELRGTVMYMSPEVARGESPSPASDVFSLGLIFVEMLTGAHPWKEHFRSHSAVQEAYFLRRLAKEPELVPNFTDGEFAKEYGVTAKNFAEGCLQFDPQQRMESYELTKMPLFI